MLTLSILCLSIYKIVVICLGVLYMLYLLSKTLHKCHLTIDVFRELLFIWFIVILCVGYLL